MAKDEKTAAPAIGAARSEEEVINQLVQDVNVLKARQTLIIDGMKFIADQLRSAY